MTKRILAILLSVTMIVTFLPMSAFAEENFEFRKLPTTGVTNITVPAGDYYTGVAAKDAFILYWDENIKTDGDFLLFDYVDTDINGYHAWMITIENGVPVATDGGFAEYYTTLYIINDIPFYESWDKWVNGTYSAIHTHAFTYTADGGVLTATCEEGCDDGFDENPLTLTLTAPENLAYDGNAKAFTFADGEADAWEAAGLELPDIIYCIKQNGQSEYLPLFGTLKFAGNYMAQITVDEKTAQVEFTIDKATPYIKTTPAPNDIEYGETLADSTLFGGYVQVSSTDSTQVAGLFEWTEPDTVPGVADSNVTLYSVTFTPVDEEKYTTVTCQIPITVTHTHNPVLVKGQEPTDAAGFKDYYECVCGAYYEDAEGKTPIDDLAAWKAEGGNGYRAPTDPIDPIETTVDLRIGDKEFYGVKGGETLEVASLDDVRDITVLTQNGVDIEGMSEDWSMSTKFLDSEGRGVLEVQVFEEGDDYVTFNLQSHYADCPGANVQDFQIMMITAKLPTVEKLLGDANDDGAVNMKDVLILRKQLAGMSPEINMINADCNEDGDVNMKDVLMLRKFLAGLITELGA